MRPRILFRGSHKSLGIEREGLIRNDDASSFAAAKEIATELGGGLILAGFDIILTGSDNLECAVGESAVSACVKTGIDPRERIRTYLDRHEPECKNGFGMLLKPRGRTSRDFRTLCVRDCDAVIGLVGGAGTSDCLQKAILAGKPVFPIAVSGGAAQQEWESLKALEEDYDIDYLADHGVSAAYLVSRIVKDLQVRLEGETPFLSRKIFIVHGHDSTMRLELAQLLKELALEPVVLFEEPNAGRTIFQKLADETMGVGFCFVLYSPDDLGTLASRPGGRKPRARQNVVFEHGLLIGKLGAEKVCAIVKEPEGSRSKIEMFSDIDGIIKVEVPANGKVEHVAVRIVKELNRAGYDVALGRGASIAK